MNARYLCQTKTITRVSMIPQTDVISNVETPNGGSRNFMHVIIEVSCMMTKYPETVQYTLRVSAVQGLNSGDENIILW